MLSHKGEAVTAPGPPAGMLWVPVKEFADPIPVERDTMPVAKTSPEKPLISRPSGAHRALYVRPCGVLPGRTELLAAQGTVERPLRGHIPLVSGRSKAVGMDVYPAGFTPLRLESKPREC